MELPNQELSSREGILTRDSNEDQGKRELLDTLEKQGEEVCFSNSFNLLYLLDFLGCVLIYILFQLARLVDGIEIVRKMDRAPLI